jgi:hypothetical protein
MNEESSGHGSTKLKALLYLFYDLIAEMEKRKLRKVLESIIHTLGYHERNRHCVTDLTWAYNESTGVSILSPSEECACIAFRKSPSAYSFTLIEQCLKEAKWILSFVQTILAKEAIWCARLDGITEPMVLFNCDVPAAIVTTTDVNTGFLRDASAPIGLLHVISVEVVKVQTYPSTVPPTFQQLAYMGEWRHGMWYAAMGFTRRYEFPWNSF